MQGVIKLISLLIKIMQLDTTGNLELFTQWAHTQVVKGENEQSYLKRYRKHQEKVIKKLLNVANLRGNYTPGNCFNRKSAKKIYICSIVTQTAIMIKREAEYYSFNRIVYLIHSYIVFLIKSLYYWTTKGNFLVQLFLQ